MAQRSAIGAFPQAASAGFDHPLEMLSACHERIADRCDLMHRLVAHVNVAGADGQAQEAAQSVLRYFDTAGEHHHADEEIDLFPKLEAAGGCEDLIALLRREHDAMRAAWRALREPLQKLARGEDARLEPAAIDAFTSLYSAHIAREESQLLPFAAKVLDAATLAAIGSAMARRRGVAHQ